MKNLILIGLVLFGGLQNTKANCLERYSLKIDEVGKYLASQGYADKINADRRSESISQTSSIVIGAAATAAGAASGGVEGVVFMGSLGYVVATLGIAGSETYDGTLDLYENLKTIRVLIQEATVGDGLIFTQFVKELNQKILNTKNPNGLVMKTLNKEQTVEILRSLIENETVCPNKDNLESYSSILDGIYQLEHEDMLLSRGRYSEVFN